MGVAGGRRRSKTWSAPLFWLVALAFFGASHASQDPEVRVERKGRGFLISAESAVAVDAATAWKVLTDYERLADFVPDMQVSRIVSPPGRPLLLEQRGETWFLIFRAEIRVRLQIEESPPERIAFRAVEGNVKSMQGTWRVTRDGRGIRLGYSAEIEPDFFVPPLIGTALLKAHVERQIAAVIAEMRRRHGDDVPAHKPEFEPVPD